jgi:hypothetical protein
MAQSRRELIMSWGNWTGAPRIAASPYVDWAHRLDAFAPWAEGFSNQVTPARLNDLDGLRAELALKPTNGNGSGNGSSAGAVQTHFPVPKPMNNADFCAYLAGQAGDTWLPDSRALPKITADDVVLGLIDVDIALGHRRFRDAEGKSRILAAWQQGRNWDNAQPFLPFGGELLAGDIHDALVAHSPRGLGAALDQDGFNRACGLVKLGANEGQKALAKRYAHGTHVMGLAGGAEPGSDFAKNVKLLVVNLPPAVAYGEGGGFLDHYLAYALHWLVDTHASIVAASGLSHPKPLTLNISFGKQAGPKEDISDFGLALRALKARAGGGGFNTFLPAGNDNMMQCNALIDLKKAPSGAPSAEGDDIQALTWRIQPDDETSNIVEIWAEFLGGSFTEAPFSIDVIPPGGEPALLVPGQTGQVRDLQNGLGRIYCDVLPASGGGAWHVRYQICLAPDSMSSKPGGRAPAGAWQIRLRGNPDFEMQVRASIQTDQATLPGRNLARRSYFEDPNYAIFDAAGRVADTFAYSSGSDHGQNQDMAGLVRRRGTINSYASIDALVIGGFRASDGRPAPYSSSALDQLPNRIMPTAAVRSDDGHAHFGLLSDGAQDGSVVAMRGTSFACALAARQEVLRQLGSDAAAMTVREALIAAARADEAGAFAVMPKGMTEKVGSGRIDQGAGRLSVSRL